MFLNYKIITLKIICFVYFDNRVRLGIDLDFYLVYNFFSDYLWHLEKGFKREYFTFTDSHYLK